MYYVELFCPRKKPKGHVIGDPDKAVRKFRQYARYKPNCRVKLYRFRWDRLEVVNEIKGHRRF